MSESTDLEFKEGIVLEKRHWVRLTKACNNRCLFCLDTYAQDGSIIAEEIVRKKIEEGRKAGANRLILSGGEPTLHKKFIDFIKYGKEIGYNWIQVVTNGRMFSYSKFAAMAVKAGLNEATFSMHGHNAKLHDLLVGVNGAFEQSVKGLKNLLDLGVVVSVDIVLNRLNLPYLREIIEFYMGIGVYEFDLLHLIPFGRAFDENFDLLSYDLDFAAPYLKRALELKDTPGLVLWTNRLPISFLEGAEELVQDPHKIYDEVLGEREAFKILVKEDKDPECMGKRCAYCPIKGFCDFAREYVHQYFAGGFTQAIVSEATWNNQSDRVIKILQSQAITTLWLKKGATEVAFKWDNNNLSKQVTGIRTYSVKAALKALNSKIPIRIVVTNAIMDELRAVIDKLTGHKVVMEYPLFERVSHTKAMSPDIEEFKALASKIGAMVCCLPGCLAGKEYRPLWRLDLDLIDESGHIELAKLVGLYIRYYNFAKSIRCSKCVYNDNCPGLQLNIARAVGLGVLNPIEKGISHG